MTEECSTDIPEDTLSHLQNLLDQQVQGLAVCAVNDPLVWKKVSDLCSQNIPVITFNSDLPESGRLCFVGQDYQKSGRIAAELISKCISKDASILAAVGNLEFDGHRSRLEGFPTVSVKSVFPTNRSVLSRPTMTIRSPIGK